ncbi:MAG: alginate export family protein [Fimbriimonadaceae bacterium]
MLTTENPSDTRTTWDLELRPRFERRLDRDFEAERGDNVSVLSDRVRVGVRHESGQVRLRLQYQYAGASTFSDRGDVVRREFRDLSEAFVEGVRDGWRVRAGRFRTSLGSGRLVASSDWGAPGRSFDGVQVGLRDTTLFALRKSVSSSPNQSATATGVERTDPSGRTLLFFHENRRSGSERSLWTLSRLQRLQVRSWNASIEAVGQVGTLDGKRHAAGAVGLEASHPIPRGRVTLQALWASGGGSSEHSRSFEAPFPSSRYRYGMMDLQAWRNLRYLSAEADIDLDDRTLLTAIATAAWLDDPADAWYGSSNRPNRARSVLRDPSGRSGREIGYELGLELVRRLEDGWTLTTGAAAFVPGGFVRAMTESADTQWSVWVQLQLRE